MRLVGSHLGDGPGVLLLGDQLLNLSSEVRDHLDELDVLSHDVHVVLLVNLLLLFETFLQTLLGVFKVSSLVFVFLFDIWVNFDVFHFLIFYVWVQILVDGPFELVEVVNVLDDPVDGILEALHKNIVGSDFGLVLLNEFTHVLLSGSEIINNISQVGINFVIMFKISVHLVCLLLQLGDFKTSWSNISLQLFDLVIQYELEFLKFLGLFLQGVDFLFQLADGLVLVEDLNALGFDGEPQLVRGFCLELVLKLLVLKLSVELINV